jgi:hypothetical protein
MRILPDATIFAYFDFCYQHESYQANSLGKSPLSPCAINSTDMAARIRPMMRVTMLIPILPSLFAMATASVNTSHIIRHTAKIGMVNER